MVKVPFMKTLLNSRLMATARLMQPGAMADVAALLNRVLPKGTDLPAPNLPGLGVPGLGVPGLNVPGLGVPGFDGAGLGVPGLGVPGLGGAGRRPAPAAQPETLPPGAKFIDGSFTNEAGTRPYKLYIPASHHGQATALIVMLHGCTQSPADFAKGTRMNAAAEAQGCLVLYPAQVIAANANKCWNWFQPGDQQRGRGEPALIAGMTRDIMRSHAVDPGRVYVAGLSAGAAAAVILGAAYPELYAAVGVHSGLAQGAAHDMGSAFSAMRQGRPGAATHSPIPTIVFHGDRDTTVHLANADAVVEQAAGDSARRRVIEGPAPGGGGHRFTQILLADAAGRTTVEQWTIHGAGHAWSGGSPAGTYTDPLGPDATKEMLRFFAEHTLTKRPPTAPAA